MRASMRTVASIVAAFGILLAFCLATAAAPETPVSASYEALSGYERVAENSFLRLWLNRGMTEVVVQDLRSGTLWYSNPPDWTSAERVLRGDSRNVLRSQFLLDYYVPGDRLVSKDNFTESVQHGQFVISERDDGIRIDYELGMRWKNTDCVPVIIGKERFEELILSRVDDSDRELLADYYTLVSLVGLDEGYEQVDVYKLDEDVVFKGYTPVALLEMLSESNRKKLAECLVDQIINHRSDLEGREDLVHTDVAQLIDNPAYLLSNKVPRWDLEDICSAVAQTGYSPEDVKYDHELNNIDGPTEGIEVFSVSMDYYLDGENLVVHIPADQISYPRGVVDKDGQEVTMPIRSLRVLPFFGAANQQQHGYILVPDGSGSLIYLNNGKLFAPPYEQRVYGDDPSIMILDRKNQSTGQCYLPVFGLKCGDSAFFAIIEEGEALASVRADVAGRNSSYNTVYSSFSIVPVGQTSLQANVQSIIEWQVVRDRINVYQSRPYEGDIQIRYAFLDGPDADYSGMARYYQDYLVRRHGLQRIEAEEQVPFVLETVGAIDRVRSVVGIPRTVVEPLTTYEEAASIAERLVDTGVRNIHLRYVGWLKGGLRHVYPSGVRFEDGLGGKTGFLKLKGFLDAHAIELYPDVSFTNVYSDTLFDAFHPRSDASRFLNRKVAIVSDYDPVSGVRIDGRSQYILSPSALGTVVDSFLSDFSRYDVDGISLRYMGRQASSDFREDPSRLVDREQAIDCIETELRRLRDDFGLSLMLDEGNAYALPYASYVLGIPAENSYFGIVDNDVPFYQMAVHGFLVYTLGPANHSTDIRRMLLRSLETGAVPHYRWIYHDSSATKDTDYDSLYSACYENWFDDAVVFHQVADAVLADLQDQRLVEHREMAEGVYQAIYENGKTVTVNYNNESVEIDGLKLSGRSYAISVFERGNEM